MFSAVRTKSVMIVVTVAQTILTMMDRRTWVIAQCVQVCWTRWV